MSTVGKNIALYRKKLGLTQEDLAKRMGYKSKTTINKIELGINDIPQSKIVKFAEALGTTPVELMGWKDDNEQLSPTKQELLNLLQTLTEEEATVIRSVIAGLRANKK